VSPLLCREWDKYQGYSLVQKWQVVIDYRAKHEWKEHAAKAYIKRMTDVIARLAGAFTI
jgi:hypothetical protein